MDPPSRDERPALVGFLARDFEVPTEAVAATLIDLAARRWLDIESAGGDQLVVRVPRREGKGALAPYEQRVLDHVHGLAVGGVVPAGALTTGTEDVSKRWWNDFAGEVVDEARDRGLCRDRWPAWREAAVRRRGGRRRPRCCGPPVASATPRRSTPDRSGAPRCSAILAIIAIGGRRRHDRAGSATPTPAGPRPGRWLGLRRFLVDHGDFPTRPRRPSPSGTPTSGGPPRSDSRRSPSRASRSGPRTTTGPGARSAARGAACEVRYPRWRPGWGRHPLMAVLTGLFWTRSRGARAARPRRGRRVGRVRRRGGRPLGRPRRRGPGRGRGRRSRRSPWPAPCAAWPTCSAPSRSPASSCAAGPASRSSPRAPRFVRWLADRTAPADPPKVRWYLGVDTGDAPDGRRLVGADRDLRPDRPGRDGPRVGHAAARLRPLDRGRGGRRATGRRSTAATVDVGRHDPALVDAAARLAERRFSPR